jgi:WD40 repeat protein
MSDNSVIEVNDDVNKIEIDVDKIDVDKNVVDKFFTFDDKRHNGKPITMIEISPKEKYLITYSEEDGSIIGWNVEDIDKVQLKFHQAVKTNEDDKDCQYEIKSLCVSDDKKLAYITCIIGRYYEYTTTTGK